MVAELNENNFKEEISKDTPIIVDFWAPWCGPCKMLGPVFEKLSKMPEYSGKARFAKVNVDDNQEIAGTYSIRGIPCLIIFKEGKELDRITGFSGEAGLKAKIDNIIK